MTVNQHATSLAGLPVRKFKVSTGAETPDDPAGVAWRVATNYEGGPDKFNRRFDALLAAPWAGQVRALVIGEWGESYESTVPTERLVAAADTFTNLTALFIGDMTSEENEISWIKQADVAPLLRAYPRLEVLRVRGADGLELAPLRHESLRELAFEAGGLPAEIVQAVGECDLPALRHLELWLGTDDYGGDATVADLTAILAGSRWPELSYLGLRDAEIVDMVAAALTGAPVVGRLSTLDLSLGVLSDVGAAALLAGQPLTHLRKLDLHHHFLSEEMMARLREELEPAGVELDLSDAQEGEIDGRFIAVSE
jgi:hypothetical protein